MLIGGKPKQILFNYVIDNVSSRIMSSYRIATGNKIMHITGPRIIQDIICNKLNIINKDGCLIGIKEPKIYLGNVKVVWTDGEAMPEAQQHAAPVKQDVKHEAEGDLPF